MGTPVPGGRLPKDEARRRDALIATLHRDGYRLDAIAERVGMSYSRVRDIVRARTEGAAAGASGPSEENKLTPVTEIST